MRTSRTRPGASKAPKRASNSFQFLPSLTVNRELSEGCRRLAGKDLFVKPPPPGRRRVLRSDRSSAGGGGRDDVDGTRQLGLLLQDGGRGNKHRTTSQPWQQISLSTWRGASIFSVITKGRGGLMKGDGGSQRRPEHQRPDRCAQGRGFRRSSPRASTPAPATRRSTRRTGRGDAGPDWDSGVLKQPGTPRLYGEDTFLTY